MLESPLSNRSPVTYHVRLKQVMNDQQQSSKAYFKKPRGISWRYIWGIRLLSVCILLLGIVGIYDLSQSSFDIDQTIITGKDKEQIKHGSIHTIYAQGEYKHEMHVNKHFYQQCAKGDIVRVKLTKFTKINILAQLVKDQSVVVEYSRSNCLLVFLIIVTTISLLSFAPLKYIHGFKPLIILVSIVEGVTLHYWVGVFRIWIGLGHISQ